MVSEKRPIGVFDSGVGGLTVVREIRRLMPAENIIYTGDTARAPYGGKSRETLISHGREIVRFLLDKGAKMIVMACGTSSSTSLEALREEFPDVPIVDTIRPAVAATLQLSRANSDFKPVFIATEATIKSGLFAQLYREEAAPDAAELYTRACPMFAPMVEAGLTTVKNHPLLFFAAETYLEDLRGQVNALILGCTHYPLLTDAITRALGEITFINPATATAEAAREELTRLKMLAPASSPGTPGNYGNPGGEVTYCASSNPKKFAEIARVILGEDCTAEKVTW